MVRAPPMVLSVPQQNQILDQAKSKHAILVQQNDFGHRFFIKC
jgi:hypothetical protein